MFSRIRKILFRPGAWRNAADGVCAALCGVFSALGMLSFDSPDAVIADWFSIASAVMLLLFILISASGMFRGPRRLPKYLFALAQIATAACFPPWLVQAAMLVLYIPLFAMLVLAVDWRGARLAALPLSLVFAWCLTGAESDTPEAFPEASFLPTALLAERPGVRMLAVGDELPVDWWRGLCHISAVDSLDTAASARGLARGRGGYDLAVSGGAAGNEVFRRELYRLLVRRLEKRGVLVLPATDISLLPRGDWRFVRLPGAGGAWLAAGDGFSPETDPEVLDRRLQCFYKDEPESEHLLLPGAFAALYPPEPLAGSCVAPVADKVRPRNWWWIAVGFVLWGLSRLWGCRGERIAAAVASGENLAAMTLYTLAVLPLWSSGEVYTGIPPRLLAAGAGVLLLPLGNRTARRQLIFVGAAIGLLPLCSIGRMWFVPQACWLLWMLSGGLTVSWLLDEEPVTIWIGAAGGILAGVALYLLLRWSFPMAFPAALTVSALLRIGILLRH